MGADAWRCTGVLTFDGNPKVKKEAYIQAHSTTPSGKVYTDIRQFICKQRHPQPCKNCEGLVNIANVILDQGFLTLLQTLLENAALKPGVKEMSISKEEMSNILYLAETESQRELLKYVVVKATGLSNTKAKLFMDSVM